MGSGGETALVATKLAPPTLPGLLVDRSRLDETLDAAVADPLVRVVLVSAPAGSGKSILAAAWQQDRSDTAWLQVDAADRDAARFWAHVVAALTTVTPTLEGKIESLIADSASAPGPLIDGLVNALAEGQPVAMVIDDYHLVASPAVDDGVERLIELAPDNFTLVLLTRWDPSLRLSRLRVGGRMVEVRATDLRFLESEAAHLLGHASTEAEALADQIRVLCDRTEGWAAGLVLARLSLTAAHDRAAFVEAFRGDDRLVVDYLSDELFAQTEPEELRRLLATSVLDEMSGPLVDAVCGSNDGASWLTDLANRNQLVVGLGRSNEWYRYHHLLRDMLRLKAEASGPIDEWHRRAGAWHRKHGDLDRSAEHLLAAGDLDEAADVIAAHSMDLLNLGQIDTVSGYFARLGPTVDTHLLCSVTQGWIHAVRGHAHEAARSLRQARVLEASHPPDPFASGLIAGLDVMLRLNEGNVGRAIAAASAAPPIADATQTLLLGQAFVWGGRFDDAEPLLDRAASLADEHGDQYGLSGVPALQSIVALERNNLEDARRYATETVTVIDERGAPAGTHGALAHAVLARTATDPAEALVAAETCRTLTATSVMPIAAAYALASAGDVLSLHDVADGADLVDRAQSMLQRLPDPGIVAPYLARVQARHRLDHEATTTPTVVDDLTDREMAVLRYLPSPMSQRDIASELFVSLNTVKTHCRAIYRKLGAGDRKAAVQAARDAGLL
ncbi:MAG: LuxR C-terminal-related transcriptional regulator [Acidimicrobiales bacterium]